jgi:hypothetical protein
MEVLAGLDHLHVQLQHANGSLKSQMASLSQIRYV